MATSADRVVVVTGAGGRLGTRLAFRLAAEGAQQRLILPDVRRAPHLTDGRPLPNASVVVCPDGAAPDVLTATFAGADTVLLVPARTDPVRPLQAAIAADVRRVVLVSEVGASPNAVSRRARDAWRAERRLRSSGLQWTVLRSSVPHSRLTDAVVDDVLRAPAGTGRVASVSHDDVADAATAVLLDERVHLHDQAVYDLTGPEALSGDDVARVLTEAVGRPITYEPSPAADPDPDAGPFHGRPDDPSDDPWTSCCAAVAAGVFEKVSATVESLAARPARSLATWLDDYPAEWAHLRG
ncbi:NAD(P)H-binding protein [Antribacter gilvus]|uniref:NAD(P)H-binding protein n=1 Tax=Antribacter gilvus TaxID=2304675 RepID=UPI000F7B1CAF|nr:NAD(P)H-binding protein [Antribacter gilvus]